MRIDWPAENPSVVCAARRCTRTGPLLSAGFTWDIKTAALIVSSRLIERLPGDPWKGEG
jgi:hypothetical protein